jgi:hypothetical protein
VIARYFQSAGNLEFTKPNDGQHAAQRLNLTDIVQVLEKILNSPESSS